MLNFVLRHRISFLTSLHFIYMYRIHSNKHPGHLDKSFGMGTYLFQYLLQGLDDFGHFQANSSHNEVGSYVSFMNRSGYWLFYGL